MIVKLLTPDGLFGLDQFGQLTRCKRSLTSFSAYEKNGVRLSLTA